MTKNIFFWCFGILLLIGCGKEDMPRDPITTVDTEGNLEITNSIEEEILLYIEQRGSITLTKRIPANSQSFLINLPSDGKPERLKVWKASEVGEENDPNEETVFRIWTVVLPTDTNIDNRVEWEIKEGNAVNVGTLIFNYPETDRYNQRVPYSVNVTTDFLGNEPIVTLSPGITNKSVPVDYDLHVLVFNYWYSNPNASDGSIQDIGTISKQDDGTLIKALINTNNQQKIIDIPAFIYSPVGKFGELTIQNQQEELVTIFANNQLIEKHINNANVSNTALSYIEPNSTGTTLPVDEGEYHIQLKSEADPTLIYQDCPNYYVLERYPSSMIVKPNGQWKEMTIHNHTEEAITIHNSIDDSYLGGYIEAGDSRLIKFPVTVSTIRVIGYKSLKSITKNTDNNNSWTIKRL